MLTRIIQDSPADPKGGSKGMSRAQPIRLLDEFDVAYAPSAEVLATLQREARQRTPDVPTLAGVGNPLPEADDRTVRELLHEALHYLYLVRLFGMQR